ncbi:chemotaxis protein CheW [Planctellipticum variicoloris]|uniref:chemotaxis protein CheW n=1 Tax=Planctellipticum variicoloris TaxID=3064265 RepID=UPI002B9C02D0|nr:chemotaxis protein CheW [Planctomycetaceae bacterium SH412]HTN02984.1 chemotaxis protein CheW [Planctomycetaceae bacterium]
MSNDSPSPTTSGQDGEPRQFLTFTLHEEEYAIDILKVQEIKGMSKITPIPNAPAHVKGVMNLRGTVVPVIDLRRRFSMASVEADNLTVIIVVNVGKQVAGLVVDTVSDVLNFSMQDVEPTPELAGGLDTSFITGLAKVEERLVTLLNIDKLLTKAELPAAETLAA